MPSLRLPFSSTAARPASAASSGRSSSVVPTGSIAGSALVMVVAIMTFLAALTLGAVDLVRGAARGWESQVGREVTIQVRPQGRETRDAVQRASALARAVPGVVEVRPLADDEIARLLEPWLGAGLKLEELPTPRLIVVRLSDSVSPDLAKLARDLGRDVPGATLDDHRVWVERMRRLGGTLIAVGFGALVLMVVATALSVLFATRGAVSGNRDVVEVLHVVGARDGYVARAFARRFLILGLKGGLLGGAAAVGTLLLIGWLSGGEQEVDMLFGSLAVSAGGYLTICFLVALVAALTALTSRVAVLAHLRRLD